MEEVYIKLYYRKDKEKRERRRKGGMEGRRERKGERDRRREIERKGRRERGSERDKKMEEAGKVKVWKGKRKYVFFCKTSSARNIHCNYINH